MAGDRHTIENYRVVRRVDSNAYHFTNTLSVLKNRILGLRRTVRTDFLLRGPAKCAYFREPSASGGDKTQWQYSFRPSCLEMTRTVPGIVIPRSSPQHEMGQMVSRVLENRSHHLCGCLALALARLHWH